jgi:hypothetical protein
MQGCRLLLCLIACLAVSACATVIEGTTDTITVSTAPPGARCDVAREGNTLGTVADTPGSLNISKSMYALNVTCNKTGHGTANALVVPNARATTFGNAILGGVIGVVVDMSTGANYRYPRVVDLRLVPDDPPPAQAATLVGSAPPTPERPNSTRQKAP